MAKLTINTGTSNDAGNGDSLRTAFTKINDNFTELYTLTGNNSTAAIKDIKGSVFGDDSTTLVDSVASSINLEGTVKGNIIPDTTEAYDIGSSSKRFKDLYLKGNTITLGSQTISSTASGISTSGTLTATAVTTTAPSTLSGTFTGDVTGSVFADDSKLLIDGVSGTIPAANLTGALPAIDGSALSGVLTSLSGAVAVKNTSDISSNILAEGDTMTVDALSIKIENGDGVRALAGESEIFFKYSHPTLSTEVSASAHHSAVYAQNVFSGKTTLASGNTTWTPILAPFQVEGDQISFDVVDHTNFKMYRVIAVARDFNNGGGQLGSVIATIQTLK